MSVPTQVETGWAWWKMELQVNANTTYESRYKGNMDSTDPDRQMDKQIYNLESLNNIINIETAHSRRRFH
jgi:hypothetical protein